MANQPQNFTPFRTPRLSIDLEIAAGKVKGHKRRSPWIASYFFNAFTDGPLICGNFEGKEGREGGRKEEHFGV